MYLEKLYYIAPSDKSERVHTLLHETLLEKGKVGIARVVIQTKQCLATLAPSSAGMVLNLLRSGEETRPMGDLKLPPEGVKGAGRNERELLMAKQLFKDMAGKWDPMQFKDPFKEKIMALGESKLKQDKRETVMSLEEAETFAASGKNAQVIDLTDSLQRSSRYVNPTTIRAKAQDSAPSEKQENPQFYPLRL